MSLLCLFMALFAITFNSCDKDEETEVLSLQFNKATVEVAVGENDTVTVNNGTSPFTATPTDATKATVSVTNNKIVVVGVKEGNTTVTVKDKNNITGNINVKVTVAEEEEEA